MSRVAELLRSRRVPQVAVLALMSVGFAGCSADMQTRFSDNSFSNPFASQPEATGSVRTPAVERRELPQYARPQTSGSQYQSQALPPPHVAAPHSYPTAQPACREEGAGLSSYAPPSHPPIETTGTVAPRSVAAPRARSGAAQTGTTIIVGTSDTLDTSGAAATTFRPPRSCRPMATRVRARCRPASN